MSEAIQIAKRRHPGKVISAKYKKRGRADGVYRIKILTRSGDVRTMEIPAFVTGSRS